MSKRYIDTNFWNDTWVDQLDTLQKFFFLYLITNGLTTIAGIYEIPIKRMRIETDLTQEQIVQMFNHMDSRVKYIDGWVVLRNGIKSQNYKNEKIRLGIKAILEKCPVDLLQYVDFPKDLGIIVERAEKEPDQQRLFNDSSMTHQDSSHLNIIKYNVIKYKSKENEEQSGKPPAEVSKETNNKNYKTNLTPAQKKSYAKAVRADEAQAERATRASGRESKPSKIDFQELKENIRTRGAKR